MCKYVNVCCMCEFAMLYDQGDYKSSNVEWDFFESLRESFSSQTELSLGAYATKHLSCLYTVLQTIKAFKCRAI